MATSLTWERKDTQIEYRQNGMLVARAIFENGNAFNLHFESNIDRPSGIDEIVYSLPLESCEYLALAVAGFHNEQRRD